MASSSSSSKTQTNISAFLFSVVLVWLCSFATIAQARPDLLQSEFLSVPASAFMTSLRSTIDTIRKVTSVVSQFANVFDDFRLSNAITDCLDLLDFSSEELTWTLSATQNPHGKNNSTGDLSSDLRAWLGAALGNQDTCIEGLDGTNSVVKSVVAGGLNQVTSLVRDVLTMVRSRPSGGSKGGGSGGGSGRRLGSDEHAHFPSWIKFKDRKLLQAAGAPAANATVAADGSGNYTRIMDAVLAAPDRSTTRHVIYIKRGVYRENVEIKKKKWNLMMIGDGRDLTIVSGNRSFIDGWTTFRSATFAVSGRGFIARDITFENTAGPDKHQAVALRCDSDLSVFFRCAMKGYQDTLYAHALRQFYRECEITGTVDFIFGDGTVVFQNCEIRAIKGLPNQKNTITAQGRRDPNQSSGFSIQFCNISADADPQAPANSTPTYLGRPWKLYSRTVVMQSFLSGTIRPEGWLEWNGDFALGSLFYAEYLNYGPGANLSSRVKWPGFHAINESTQVTNFTVAQFIDGNLWLPSTGVKYTG